MSTNMYTEGIISMIKRSEDKYPHDYPTATRMGYAAGLVGLVALTVSDDYMAEEFYDTIRGYAATLRQERALAETDESTAKLLSREFICYDILDLVSDLEHNHNATKANRDVVSNNAVTVNEGIESVINMNAVVQAEEDTEFVLINEVESDASHSEADSSEWELV
ncbi:hypothetical protein B0H65DRAFT_570678 [Neurospora tetraspora]|uniref:Uncharacterized protein n=1 Tax=Neurospora tetraspora TaxID=94610 RepID=A0AAE0JH93_9PEZI|nr:hypothetical protein B0H65DRAFT_570678 [Neurospora tetraspora]